MYDAVPDSYCYLDPEAMLKATVASFGGSEKPLANLIGRLIR